MRKRVMLIMLCFILCIVVSTEKSAHAFSDKNIQLHLGENELAFTFIDLTNGEATLIHGQNKNIIVNTGGRSSRQELHDQLEAFHVSKIDQIILTNKGKTYTGNLSWLIDEYNVKHIVTSDLIKKTFCNEESAAFCHLFNPWGKIKTINILPNLQATLLSVSPSGSINILFLFGANKILYMGYSDQLDEMAIIKNRAFPATVLKVGEYGEDNGAGMAFLDKVDPEMAVIFHSNNNQPSDNLLTKLEMVWMDIYQLHKVGSVTLRMTPEKYDVLTIPHRKISWEHH